MHQTKKLLQSDWQDFFATFSNGNKGRMIAIEALGMVDGPSHPTLSSGLPLLAIDYDPASKGDELVISTGKDSLDYTHTIGDAYEIWYEQDDNGQVVSLEVLSRNELRTIIIFK